MPSSRNGLSGVAAAAARAVHHPLGRRRRKRHHRPAGGGHHRIGEALAGALCRGKPGGRERHGRPELRHGEERRPPHPHVRHLDQPGGPPAGKDPLQPQGHHAHRPLPARRTDDLGPLELALQVAQGAGRRIQEGPQFDQDRRGVDRERGPLRQCAVPVRRRDQAELHRLSGRGGGRPGAPRRPCGWGLAEPLRSGRPLRRQEDPPARRGQRGPSGGHEGGAHVQGSRAST